MHIKGKKKTVSIRTISISKEWEDFQKAFYDPEECPHCIEEAKYIFHLGAAAMEAMLHQASKLEGSEGNEAFDNLHREIDYVFAERAAAEKIADASIITSVGKEAN